MTPELASPRPEVLGRLNLAASHERIGRWSASKKHLSKAQKHRHRAAELARKWLAQHPQQAEAMDH